MAEEFEEAIKEGKRIVREYLSQLGWARTSTQTAVRHIIPEWTREEREEIFRKSDKRLEDAEEKFGKEVDAYRKENTEFARKVLETVYGQLKNRRDLGFFAKKMISRLKEELYG